MFTEKSRYNLNKFQAQPYSLFDKVLPEMAETLGDLIRRRMKDVGIKNNSELARLIKRSDAYVGDLVNDRGKTKSGTYKPSPETLANLAKVLKVSEIEILNAIGYTAQNAPMLPEPLNIMDFDGFDEEDLKDIREYIEFKRTQKEKAQQKK
jgi:transcriptional regulator with XRE-family HTH domain